MTTPGFSRGRAAGLVLDASSKPFDWCDRRCERCPLAGGCAMLRAERGEGDPRDEHDEHDEGDEGDEGDERGDGGLENAADATLFGLGDLLDALERGTPVEPFEGLVAATAFVIGRARRLAAEGPRALQRSGGASLDWETSASVVLLDRYVAGLGRTVEALRPERPAAALAAGLSALASEVARWNTRVSDAFRIALGARIRDGTAPSPFCTTDH